MTPCILNAKKAGIPHTIHKYKHDPAGDAYGTEAAAKLGIPRERIFKTLVVRLNTGTLAVGIVPVSAMMSLKRMAKACGAGKAAMAPPKEVERSTGYVLGGVSPLGQKKQLLTVLDASATGFPTIYVSAGRRGLEIELSPEDLQKITRAATAVITDDTATPWR